MARAIITIAAVMALAAPAVHAGPAAKDMYEAALAREQAVRGAFETAPPPEVLADVHAVVGAYRAVVRRFPTSGYSDNALW